jgi:hypothetical protein
MTLPMKATLSRAKNNGCLFYIYTLNQCCPTFLYIGAHLTDVCGGAGACGDCNNNNNNNNNNNQVISIEILIKMTTDFIFYDSIS